MEGMQMSKETKETKQQIKENEAVANVLNEVNGELSSEELSALALSIFRANPQLYSRIVVKESKVEPDGTIVINQVTTEDTQAPNALKDPTLVSIIERIFVEKSKSRQIRYQLYVDKDKKVLRKDFDRCCHTLAYLASLRNHDAEITITDDFGEIALFTPKQYKTPNGLLYNIVNFSNRVYLNEAAKDKRIWCSSTTIEPGYDEAKLMRPDELETFIKHFNSEAKDGEKWECEALTKDAIAYSNVAGGVYEDADYTNGKKFVRMNNVTTGITEAVVMLRGITLEGFEKYGRDDVPLTMNEYIKKALNAN